MAEIRSTAPMPVVAILQPAPGETAAGSNERMNR